MNESLPKKLSRAEACAELARRIGLTVRETTMPEIYEWQVIGASGRRVAGSRKGSKEAMESVPFFTSRDAAAELVRWMEKREPACFVFLAEVRTALAIHGMHVPDDAFRYLLATPEQITLAACAAIGLEVE
jgi:hypothetical protein